MKSKIEKCERILGNKYFALTFPIIAYLVVLFFSSTTSAVYGIEGFDSAVFKTMGRVFLDGGVPYVDYFDHKGPNLYLINAIGEYLSPDWGLFAIQVVWLSVTLVLWYRIALLLARPVFAFVVLLLTVLFFSDYLEYGNHVEEWALLPSSLTLYLSISYLLKHKDKLHPKWRSLVYGLCFGFIFFLRPNDAVIQCGGVMLGIFLYICIIQKQYANAILNALAFILGFIIMSAPWIVYFTIHHALDAFYFGLLGFNIGYSGGFLSNIANVIITIKLLVLWGAPLLFLSQTNKKQLYWLLIPVCILSLLFFGRNSFPHYYISLVPYVYLLSFALLFNLGLRIVTVLGIFMLLLNPTDHPSVHRGYGAFQLLVHHHYDFDPISHEGIWEQQMRENLDKIFNIVPENERDSIWNYSDEFSGIFYLNGIVAQNPVPPVIATRVDLFPEERRSMLDISLHRPLWIYIEKAPHYILSSDSAFIADNYYVANQSTTSKYLLMRRKD